MWLQNETLNPSQSHNKSLKWTTCKIFYAGKHSQIWNKTKVIQDCISLLHRIAVHVFKSLTTYNLFAFLVVLDIWHNLIKNYLRIINAWSFDKFSEWFDSLYLILSSSIYNFKCHIWWKIFGIYCSDIEFGFG